MKAENLVVNICPMTRADISEVKRMEVDYNLSPWSIEDYYSELERADSISLTAIVDKKIVGFIVARLINILNLTSYEIEIHNICVNREFRRNNIGKSLIEELVKVPKRHTGSVWVDVRKSNHNALAFYNKLNFKTIYMRKNFYRNPSEDGIVLKMEFR